MYVCMGRFCYWPTTVGEACMCWTALGWVQLGEEAPPIPGAGRDQHTAEEATDCRYVGTPIQSKGKRLQMPQGWRQWAARMRSRRKRLIWQAPGLEGLTHPGLRCWVPWIVGVDPISPSHLSTWVQISSCWWSLNRLPMILSFSSPLASALISCALRAPSWTKFRVSPPHPPTSCPAVLLRSALL